MREGNNRNQFFLDADFKEQVRRRKDVLENLIRILSTKGRKYPKGTLRIVDKKSYVQYYWRKEVKDTNGVYISKDNLDTAKALAQRDYEQKLLEKAKEEHKFITKYWEYITENAFEELYTHLHRGRKTIVIPIVPDQKKFIEEWLAEVYEPMPFMENTEFYSNDGVRVRSKSELIIVNLLEQYGVPYKYEKPIYLRGLGQVRPDFTCLNMKTRKEYVWEHFGMMDNAGYASKNVEKISIYQLNNMFPGKDLITTFETSQYPLSSKVIKGVIEEFLL